MKTLPVTPELISILENALADSSGYIDECSEALESYGGHTRELVIARIERRRQLLAVTEDLLKRFK
jgi:hypothetical protein